MAASASNIKIRRSTTSGSAGNSLTQSDATLCNGKYIATTDVPSGLNGVFPDVSGDDNTNQVVRYACLFFYNADTVTAQTVRVSIDADPAGGAAFALAVDTTAASAVGSSSAQALVATSMTVVPSSVSGLTYSAPTSDASGVVLGDVPAGYVRPFWLRLTGAQATTAVTPETVTLTVAWE